MTGSGKIVEVQGTAEGEPFDRDQLDRMLDLAAKGVAELVANQRAARA
jgi:ribonuclease PH